jgi:hypothetical protein
VLARDLGDRRGDPAVILVLEIQRRQRIATMGIESGRDQDQLRREAVESRQHCSFHRLAEGLAVGMRPQQRVDDVVGDAVLLGGAGARIERPLMGRGEEQRGVALEHHLRAVAVVDVEIDHRDAPEPVRRARMQRADGDVVEQAEAHRHRGLGMVAGRPHGAERVLRLAADHRIDRRDHGTRRAQRRLAGAGAQAGVGVELMAAGRRHGAQHALHVLLGMREHELAVLGARRLAPLERLEDRVVERGEDGFQALRPLRMPGSRIVVEAGRMGHQKCRHRLLRALLTRAYP